MNFKRISAVALSGVLLVGALAGCTKPAGGNTTPDASATPAPSASAAVGSIELYDDVVQTIMGYPSDTTVLNINGRAVSADAFLYNLAYLTEYMVSSAGAEAMDWTMDMGEGKTIKEYLLDVATQECVYRAVVQDQAAQRGFTLTEENQKELDATIEQLVTQMGSEEIFRGRLQELPVTEETFRGFYADNYLLQQVQEAACGKAEDIAADNEAVTAWAEGKGYILAKHILLSTKNDDQTEKTDEEKAAVKKEAEDMVAEIRAAADPAKRFDELMNEKSADGRDANGKLYAPDGYLFGTGEMVEEFETGAKALKFDEISDPIQTSYGYHIILRLAPVNDEAVSKWRSEMYNQKVNDQMQEWIDAAKVETTKDYDAIDPEAFYNKLTEVRTELESRITAATATPTPAPTASAAPDAAAPTATPAPTATSAPQQ